MTVPSAVEIEDVAVRVGDALDALGVRYLVGGSVASSLLGEPRGTNDIDLLVELTQNQVDPFIAKLGPDFEVDDEALRDAIRRKRSWNIFFLPLVTKVDLFIKRDHPFDESELQRRLRIQLGSGGQLYLATAEDIVLRKLAWYRAGGESSSSQWRDVLGVLRLSTASIDWTYLDQWAPQLGVEDLLRRVRQESESTLK